MNNKSEREKYYMEVMIDDDDDHIFSMPKYISMEKGRWIQRIQGYLRPQFDYDKLRVVKVATNLNKVRIALSFPKQKI